MEQSFNTNLRMLRKQKGLTQEQLADAVGVSAQAVSKWELSSFPDAQLLPAVADCLGVTIDELFGRKKEKTPDIYTQITEHLRSIPVENRFQEAFQLCWLICQSSDDFLNPDPSDKSFLDNNEISLYSETTNSHGFLQARLNRSLQYFLLMPEPEGGFDHFLSYHDHYVQLFEALAFPDALRALYFLAGKYNSNMLGSEEPNVVFFTEQTIAYALSVTEAHAHEIIEKLLPLRLIHQSFLDFGKKQEPIYFYYGRCDFVSFMTFTHTLLNTPTSFRHRVDRRDAPYFRQETYRKTSEKNETGPA